MKIKRLYKISVIIILIITILFSLCMQSYAFVITSSIIIGAALVAAVSALVGMSINYAQGGDNPFISIYENLIGSGSSKFEDMANDIKNGDGSYDAEISSGDLNVLENELTMWQQSQLIVDPNSEKLIVEKEIDVVTNYSGASVYINYGASLPIDTIGDIYATLSMNFPDAYVLYSGIYTRIYNVSYKLVNNGRYSILANPVDIMGGLYESRGLSYTGPINYGINILRYTTSTTNITKDGYVYNKAYCSIGGLNTNKGILYLKTNIVDDTGSYSITTKENVEIAKVTPIDISNYGCSYVVGNAINDNGDIVNISLPYSELMGLKTDNVTIGSVITDSNILSDIASKGIEVGREISDSEINPNMNYMSDNMIMSVAELMANGYLTVVDGFVETNLPISLGTRKSIAGLVMSEAIKVVDGVVKVNLNGNTTEIIPMNIGNSETDNIVTGINDATLPYSKDQLIDIAGLIANGYINVVGGTVATDLPLTEGSKSKIVGMIIDGTIDVDGSRVTVKTAAGELTKVLTGTMTGVEAGEISTTIDVELPYTNVQLKSIADLMANGYISVIDGVLATDLPLSVNTKAGISALVLDGTIAVADGKVKVLIDGVYVDAVPRAITAEQAVAEAGDIETAQTNIDDMPKINDLKLPQLVTTKFPFSIPWDLYRCVNVLVASPAPPIYVLPFKVGTYVDEEIQVDLNQFEPLAVVSRFFTMLVFSIAIVMATRKLIGQ